jgi:mono/diheme cytochrome c family protein
VAFSALAKESGDLGTRANAVLARINWPGKAPAPGAPAPLAPLTPEQQRLYDTGQTLFNSVCMACHGDDGKGREQGPPLIGSQFALAPPQVPIRILLQGKEGSVGLMPPLGATLTDEQIAGALTFIRRQWGNAAGPVDPGTVKEIRAATTGRTRPWTNDELLAIAGAGRGGQAPRP